MKLRSLFYAILLLSPLAAWAVFNAFPIPTASVSTYKGLPQAFNAANYGWTCNDTDQSTAALALLAAVSTAGGGTIYFPPCASKYRADSQLFIPNNSASQPSQVNIRLTGGGGGQIWGGPGSAGAIASVNAATLDLRFHGTLGNAKIESRGLGGLSIDNLTLMDGGTSDPTPFIHATNTTITIRNNTFVGNGNAAQDAIVLGGTSTAIDGTVNAAFQGYGSLIDSNIFKNLNRGVYGRTYVNGLNVTNNSWEASATGASSAMEFDGSQSLGNAIFSLYVAGNTIEMPSYQYGVTLTNVMASNFINNGFYDGIMSNPSLFDYNLQNAAQNNTFLIGQSWTATPFGGQFTAMMSSTIIGGKDHRNDLSGLGIVGSEFANGTVIRGFYDSTKLTTGYAGQLTVVDQAVKQDHLTLGIDETNQRVVIDAYKEGVSTLPLSLNPSGGAVVLTLPTSCTGLPTGALRNNTGVVNVCP